MSNYIEKLDFRAALGSFATGITVITATDNAGQALGMTVSSFNSLSLSPPLVLWSIGENASAFDNLVNSSHYAIHILAEHQSDLASRFANTGTDKFSGVDVNQSELGLPIISGCCAVFECRNKQQYEGGDHTIMIGEVLRLTDEEKAPLIFHGGNYRQLAS